MAIGKYITNMGVITTLLGGLGVRKQTKRMPQDWRRALVWLAWGSSVVLAIASVSKADEDRQFLFDREVDEKAKKRREKAMKKAEKKARTRVEKGWK